jgi:Protein of unknown function (DUF4241)
MLNYNTYFTISTNSNLGCDVVELGKLYMPSGKIFCCDPFLSSEVNAFERCVKPGYYDLKLCTIEVSDWGKRVALAALVFSDRKPLNWVKATYRIYNESFTGFRVDAGLACFMDSETAELFRSVVDRYYEKYPDGNYYDDVLAAEFKKNADPTNPQHIGDWNLHYPINSDPRNIAMFASGLGDGVYSTYLGLDENEQPVMLVADFELL